VRATWGSVAGMKNTQFHYRVVDTALKHALRIAPLSSLSERIALWWGYRYQPSPSVIKLRSGAKMHTTHVDHLQLLLYYTGAFEEHCVRAMREKLRPGQTVLDVGANIGLFTVEAAKAVGITGKVISIEALPSHAATVREAANLNQFKNVEVAEFAVGQADGEAVLSLPANSNFGSYTLGAVTSSETVTVPVRKIDDIVSGRPIDFIKMDIEGSELNALIGAEITIRNNKPPILIELNENALQVCGASSREVKTFLFDHGYRGRLLPSGREVKIDQRHYCDECLFVQRD
jgi:FkbM family methyltransferase